jgi:uncharacterized membrane protein
MKNFLPAFCIALVSMLILDTMWIGFIANHFYKTEMGAYYSASPLLWAAAIFYIIYIAGLVHFVIKPSLTHTSFSHAALNGALFALVAFGTYDLTNLSIVPHWPVILSVVDMAWGTVEGAIVASIAYFIIKTFTKSP